MIKKTYKLSGLHCTSCAMLIEGELEDIGADAKCNWVKQNVEVDYDPKIISEDIVIQAIQKNGYKIVG
ncbi:MAG: hypothetical protein UX91_C0004G0077 [Candidatus Amesbacteria bacterium GW2011_GWB1_47_19]|nr:MAG: hypothetical protein UW51_C0005G0077 [Candidatus Amesbacteria bacterium GW2011_GWA1_44_24]KKU31634.1 MAG: hypothetical protein UX46_C0004G0077 [Candidatus Amesbacteria bacterium GW2011_GWC1_46_24]KKU67407.1 MAG: hypothetical protein UX91_C0004G0077 [Candidatus Amesbacteria bacterium GW2011_GWB1_47_19]OGD05375.1 MAG: hypothetical protein A2379_05350 [Candidatus Amesbacteria bacterium RIFOXYB1_FULL_47_13]